ncbi:hypothetical protein [Schlesneria sp. T3-172]|uniref:hypothetical protein n=1 Tax=Schlesneria sphaerica TaxID=3373610 RepID=UPI0037C94048
MWIVRLVSMLALAVALLLPAPLFRDCCCAKRAESTHVTQPKLSPCCQARLAAQKAAKPKRPVTRAVTHTPTGTGLSRPDCQCQSAEAVPAIVSAHEPSAPLGSNSLLVGTLEWAPSFTESGTSQTAQRDLSRASGPPLRKLLCRWVI